MLRSRSNHRFEGAPVETVEVITLSPTCEVIDRKLSSDPAAVQQATTRIEPDNFPISTPTYSSHTGMSPGKILGIGIVATCLGILGLRSYFSNVVHPPSETSAEISVGGTIVGFQQDRFYKSSSNRYGSIFEKISAREAAVLLSSQWPDLIKVAEAKHAKNPDSVDPQQIEDALKPYLIESGWITPETPAP